MSENVREVLEAAIEKIMPAATPKTWTDAQWVEWYNKRTRFKQLLDFEAYTDAALMLVPDGWDFTIYSRGEASIHRSENGRRTFYEATATAKTPATDLAQAALAAKGTGNE